ncbi:hypothetical protein A9R04_24700 [Nocardiopsis dassonvillei]|uniref:hypothetical protein n=1 Tax=Nocardiopsis dassonvillei TaxID=2014 RepID=UPI0008FC8717|nr:hypothetical protein [Nocardiopsis dassonvillei]APC37678.1 hypothetical protein A9R04_24700 [Nocardiopsis dassonvillei]
MTQQPVYASIEYPAVCQGCGGRLECQGVQALVGGSLRWDIECACRACGSSFTACGGALPDELRDRILDEHGPVKLLVDPSAGNVAIMRVLRAELGIGLTDARAVLDRVLAGDYSGTLPEVELLARRLRAAGVEAASARC